ncbi:hypothetical protein C2845_PM04G01430 [Panicum miliaceum]|uniref:FBD domain-containing protein n=1 Tax=Panicum miliaceum TaxID=4540 RepID=A0A3L6QUJ0_PANMI|nr:hypothetical protein C2845_PM04G01430 [Panicum miliaceum]
MKHLQSVCPILFLVYGFSPNDAFREFLRCFKAIQVLCLTLVYLEDIDNLPYLMEDMKILPDVAFLDLATKLENQEVEITELRGSEHEVTFVKQLFSWATVLRKMTVTFKSLVTESIANELCLVLRSFSRPEISLEFYMTIKVLYAPED